MCAGNADHNFTDADFVDADLADTYADAGADADADVYVNLADSDAARISGAQLTVTETARFLETSLSTML